MNRILLWGHAESHFLHVSGTDGVTITLRDPWKRKKPSVGVHVSQKTCLFFYSRELCVQQEFLPRVNLSQGQSRVTHASDH